MDVVDGVAGAVEFDALVAAGEEAGGPLSGGDGLGVTSALAGEDDEAGEVLGFGAEAIGDPCAHGGAAADGGAGIHERVGGVMVDLFRDHGADDADVVGHFGVIGEEVGDFLSIFAVAVEGGHGALGFERLALELGDGLAGGEGGGEGLSVELGEFGFIVERFEVGRASGHAEEDDAFDAGFVVGEPGGGGCGERFGEERREG
ncbi:MAG: hypothetical protein RI897_3894 [Verrucomicrobiota bacterium]